MKYLILLLLFLLPACAKNLSPMNPDKPVYQNVIPGVFGISGYWKEVKPVTVEELKELHKAEFTAKNKQKMWDRGFLFLSIGIPLFFAGLFMSTILAQYGLQMIAHFLAPSGLTMGCSGAAMMELAELWVIVTMGVFCLIVYGAISLVLKDKGISISGTSKKTKKKR